MSRYLRLLGELGDSLRCFEDPASVKTSRAARKLVESRLLPLHDHWNLVQGLESRWIKGTWESFS